MPLDITGRVDSIIEDSTLELECKYQDSAGAASDPTVVELKITEVDLTVITKTKAGLDLTNPAVGTWQYRHKFEQVGRVEYEWFGESAGSSSSEVAKASVEVVAR